MSRILNHLNIQNKIKAILHQIHSVFLPPIVKAQIKANQDLLAMMEKYTVILRV